MRLVWVGLTATDDFSIVDHVSSDGSSDSREKKPSLVISTVDWRPLMNKLVGFLMEDEEDTTLSNIYCAHFVLGSVRRGEVIVVKQKKLKIPKKFSIYFASLQSLLITLGNFVFQRCHITTIK